MFVKHPNALGAKVPCIKNCPRITTHQLCNLHGATSNSRYLSRRAHCCAVPDVVEEVASTSEPAQTFASLGVHKLFVVRKHILKISANFEMLLLMIMVCLCSMGCQQQAFTPHLPSKQQPSLSSLRARIALFRATQVLERYFFL